MRTWQLGRFSVEGAAAAARTALGSALLVGIAGRSLAALGRCPLVLHRAERSWAAATRRFLGMELELTGAEHIDPRGQYVILPLHEGFADALVVLALGLPVRFVARDELFEWPALGRYLQATGQIVLPTASRLRHLRTLLRQMDRAVEDGVSPVIFPQGSVLGIEVAFAPGAFRLVARAGLPVLPVVITGTHQVWEYPFSTRLRYRRRVTARVLPPLDAGRACAHSRELERVMKRLALDPEMAPPRRYQPDRDGYWEGYTFQIDPEFPRVHAQVAAHRAASLTPENAA